MTRNPKPGTLPDGFDEQLQNAPEFALLTAANRLTRGHVLARIVEASGVDLDVPADHRDALSKRDIARLASHLSSDGRSPDYLKRNHTKIALCRMVADAVGAAIDVQDHQDGFTKRQAIQVWFALEAGITVDVDPHGDGSDDQATDGSGAMRA